MIRVYDYKCPEGHVHELFSPTPLGSIVCPTCGEVATRQLSAPPAQLEGTTGAFPGAYHRWEAKRAEKLAVERKKARDHGEA